MLSDLLIKSTGFYKHEFMEFEGNIEFDDGQIISYELVEERMLEEMNYFDPLYHILEMDKEENEGYYCNMVFLNKCDSKGFDENGFDVNGFDVNGFNKKGYDTTGYDKKEINRKGYSKWGGNNLYNEYDPDRY